MSVLDKHKSKSKVCQNELGRFAFGNEQRMQRLKRDFELVENSRPPGVGWPYYEMSRVDKIKTSYKAQAQLVRLQVFEFENDELPMEASLSVQCEISGGVSSVMTRPFLSIICTEEQKAKWIPLFDKFFLYGVYAQTEMGHGSDVQSLETEAVYDHQRREFIINSPTISSIKWWPGEVSNISSVALVFAKTIINGKKTKVLPFIVQIRDFVTHKPMPGVEIGDIGPKLAYHSKENGFLRFVNVRIPVENMPARFTEISPEGNLVNKGNPKVMYSAMTKTRCLILGFSSAYLANGVVVALRYSFFRKQFKNELKEETPVIQYQLQQYKLFGLLAKVYAMKGCFNVIKNMVLECDQQVARNDFSNLQEIHVILSGAKAWFTWWCEQGLRVCLNCCGGHGFSAYSGIVPAIEMTSPHTILEGENSMLSLQVGTFLLKCMKLISEGRSESLSGYCQYLKGFDQLLTFNETFQESIADKNTMVTIWKKAVAVKLSHITERIVGEVGESSIKALVNSKIGVSLFEVSKMHTVLFTFDFFLQYIESVKHKETREALERLALLFIAEQTIENAHLLLGFGVLSQGQLNEVHKSIPKCVELLYPDCLALAEVFVLNEGQLFSAIANRNEKPYDNLYKTAKQFALLNSTDLTSFYLKTIRKSSIETFGRPKL